MDTTARDQAIMDMIEAGFDISLLMNEEAFLELNAEQ